MAIALISNSDCGRHDTGWGHPEHAGRLRAIPKALRDDPELFHRIQHVESRHASVDELALAHDRTYIEKVKSYAAAGGGRLDPDTIVSDGSWDAATAAAGAVLDGVDFAFGDGPPTKLLRRASTGPSRGALARDGFLSLRQRGGRRALLATEDTEPSAC